MCVGVLSPNNDNKERNFRHYSGNLTMKPLTENETIMYNEAAGSKVTGASTLVCSSVRFV